MRWQYLAGAAAIAVVALVVGMALGYGIGRVAHRPYHQAVTFGPADYRMMAIYDTRTGEVVQRWPVLDE